MKLPESKKKIALIVLVNFIVFFTLYLVGVRINAYVTFIIYTVLFGVTVIGYIIYNRGFTRKNVTLDMLPEEWPPEKKTEFIEDGKRRIEKSKWVLTIMLPMVAIYAYELIDIYVMPIVMHWIG